MGTPSIGRSRVVFGLFEADLGSGELYRSGRRVALQDKPFRILAMLLEHPGEVVARDEVRKRLWPEGTFVDFDEGIDTALKKLRFALGDSAQNPIFIETIPRRGYRFIAGVTPVQEEQSSQTRVAVATSEANETHPRSWQSARPWVAFFFLLIFGILLGWQFRVRRGLSGIGPNLAIHSIAVLPLTNLSGDASQDYFAEGLTDELITNLGQVPSLRVISRTSVNQYKGTRKPLPQIARELHVDAIVEGSALLVGSKVRITAQLIEASTDAHLWAKSYDGEVRDLLSLQSEVASAIAAEIRLKFTGNQNDPQGRRPMSPEAYDAYLKGRYFWNRRDGGGLERAISYYQQAVQIDPGYAPAYAGLAQSYVLLAGSHATIADNIDRGKIAARRALELDPSSPEAHTALALLLFHEWNFAGAEHEYKLAVSLGPNYATAHHWYGDGFLVLMGRFEETNFEMKQAVALDPVSSIIATDWGQVLRFERRYDAAYQQLSQVLDMDPGFSQAYSERGLTLLHQRKLAAAVADLEASRRIDDSPRRMALLGYGYGLAGQRENALQILKKLRRSDGAAYVGSWAEAIVHIGLGENNDGLKLLSKALEERSADCIGFKVDPIYDSVRNDPRFESLLRRTGLPQ